MTPNFKPCSCQLCISEKHFQGSFSKIGQQKFWFEKVKIIQITPTGTYIFIRLSKFEIFFHFNKGEFLLWLFIVHCSCRNQFWN